VQKAYMDTKFTGGIHRGYSSNADKAAFQYWSKKVSSSAGSIQ